MTQPIAERLVEIGLRGRIAELEAEIERLRVVDADKHRLTEEVMRLRQGMREYACTATDHPCGCYNEFLSEKAEIEGLKKLLAVKYNVA